MVNYSHRQLFTGLFTLLCLLGVASPGLADEVDSCTRMEVVDVSNDSISFIKLSGKTITKPLADVRRVIIDDFPLFSAAERLLSSGNHEDAVAVYEDALEGLANRQKLLLRKSFKLRKANKTKDFERCSKRSRAKWPKKLFELRMEQAKKGPLSKNVKGKTAQIKTNPSKTKANQKKSKSCRICRGTGLTKCPGCNGSGNVKCTHIDNEGKKHAKWYEACRRCNGKGKVPVRRWKDVKYLSSDGKWRTKNKLVTEYDPCPASNCFSTTNQNEVKIYVTWVCPHCGGNRYKGYIKCTECNKGKLKCEACKGTGKKNTNPAPASPKQTHD